VGQPALGFLDYLFLVLRKTLSKMVGPLILFCFLTLSYIKNSLDFIVLYEEIFWFLKIEIRAGVLS